MRKISNAASVTFTTVNLGNAVLSWYVVSSIESGHPWLAGGIVFYFLNILFFKLWLSLTPFPLGKLQEGTRENYRFGVYLLFWLFYVGPLSSSKLIPAPFTSWWYRFFGASIGKASFPANSMICEPPLVTLGDQVTLGYNSLLTPHIMVGEKLDLQKIIIQHQATLGVNCVVYGDVEIGEGSLVLANSSVVPGTRISPYEMWGGNPAKKIRNLASKEVA